MEDVTATEEQWYDLTRVRRALDRIPTTAFHITGSKNFAKFYLSAVAISLASEASPKTVRSPPTSVPKRGRCFFSSPFLLSTQPANLSSLSQALLGVFNKSDPFASWDFLYDLREQSEIRRECHSIIGTHLPFFSLSNFFLPFVFERNSATPKLLTNSLSNPTSRVC